MIKKFFRFILLSALIFMFAAGAFYYFYSKQQVQELTASKDLNTLFTEVQHRPDFVPGDQIPQFLKEATVALEDARYYEHDGLDLIGLVRAGISQVIPIFDKSGGSTITQQVIKNLYGEFDGGIAWKGTEMLLALELDKNFSKDEILAVYLNIINYGDNYNGIGQASAGYFACTPLQLNEAESSLLAGIPQSPTNFALSTNFAAAKNKQKVVLDAMVRHHMVTQEQADQIYAEPIHYIAYGQWLTGTAYIPIQLNESVFSF